MNRVDIEFDLIDVMVLGTFFCAAAAVLIFAAGKIRAYFPREIECKLEIHQTPTNFSAEVKEGVIKNFKIEKGGETGQIYGVFVNGKHETGYPICMIEKDSDYCSDTVNEVQVNKEDTFTIRRIE